MVLSSGCSRGEEILKEDTILKINSTEVSLAEYKLFVEQEKALTYNHFYTKHGAPKTDTFWETDFDGETPSTFIKEKIDQKLVRVKVIQEYAAKVKLINSFNYTDFLKDWKDVNRRREEKHRAGQIVYGPVQTGKQEYYNYLFTNLELKLKDKLNGSVFVPSPARLKAYFKEISASHFSFVDTIATEQLILSYATQTERTERLKLAKEITKDSGKRRGFASIAKMHPYANYRKKQYLATDQLYGEENRDRELKAAASELELHQIKVIDFQQKINDGIYVVKLLKPLKKSFKAFEDVKQEVLYFYQVEQYRQLVDSLIRGSSLVKEEGNYRGLGFE